jgi:hypothetical protein
MSAIKSYMHWFLIGMGQVMGISHTMPQIRPEMTEIEAIGGDFRAVGNDFRYVLKYRSKEVSASPTEQMELAGISS